MSNYTVYNVIEKQIPRLETETPLYSKSSSKLNIMNNLLDKHGVSCRITLTVAKFLKVAYS